MDTTPTFIGVNIEPAPAPVFLPDISEDQLQEEAWAAVADNTQGEVKFESPEEKKDESDLIDQFDTPPEITTQINLVPYTNTSSSKSESPHEVKNVDEAPIPKDDGNYSGDTTIDVGEEGDYYQHQHSEELFSDEGRPGELPASPIHFPSESSPIIEPHIIPETQCIPETQEPQVIPETQEVSAIPETQHMEYEEVLLMNHSIVRPTSRLPDLDTSCILEEKWEDLEHHLFEHNRKILPAYGDGFCFLYALEIAFTIDHRFCFNIDSMTHMIIGEIQDHPERYLHWYVGELEDLVADTIVFFESKQYDRDVVDLVVIAASNALKIDLYIYQENFGAIQLKKAPGSHATKSIYVVRTEQRGKGHYDAVVKRGSRATLQLPLPPDDEQDEPFEVEDCYNIDAPIAAATPQEHSSEQVEDAATHFIDLTANDDIYLTQEKLKAKRTKFPDQLFIDIEHQVVDELPDDVDGTCKFHILITPKESVKKQGDMRHFDMKVSKRKGFSGRRRVGWCTGSLLCTNDQCPFFKASTERNVSHWKGGPQSKCCFSCGYEGVNVACRARKMTEYDFKTNILKICHLNKHTCSKKMDKKKYDAALERVASQYPNLPGISAINAEVAQYVNAGDIEMAQSVAKETANAKRFLQIQRKFKSRNITGRQSIESVAETKEGCDKVDKFLIWRINGEGMNDQPGYVSKHPNMPWNFVLKWIVTKEEYYMKKNASLMACTVGVKTGSHWQHGSTIQLC